jgi:DNA helicase IV
LSNQAPVETRTHHSEVREEQEHVSQLYQKLDGLREQALDRRARALRETGGTHQARYERDMTVNRLTDQVAQFDAVEEGLCFGRLDYHDDLVRRIGRIGIFDDSRDYEPLLLDWRAPAARPFYTATAASPEGVRRRRHVRTRGRTVVGVNDEVLDLATARPEGLTGEAALLAAVNAGRTGRMRDIVETIQAEQDRVIRADLNGVLVVQGGPGTGKTAVALHRAAYLLYTYRRQLAKRGVMVIGPNTTFVRYISQVLPSLAETDVLLRTVGELYPGVAARRAEPPEVAEVKGRERMRKVLANAVADRQRVPEDAVRVRAEIGYTTETLKLHRAMCERARERARRSRRPHNLARPIFVQHMLAALTRQLTRRIGGDPYGGANLLDERDVADLHRELRDSPEVRAALDSLWPLLTPQRLLTELYASEDALISAAPRLSAADRRRLLRPTAETAPGEEPCPEGGWTAADVPLLDEAAELLGEDDSVARALEERRRRERIGYAEGVLALMEGSRSFDFEDEEAEVLVAMDLIGAEELAERQREVDYRTPAERAAEDRTWAFGHIIIDEAQELSPMAWRLLLRRCPARSMTIVGDVAQTGDLSGASSWSGILDPHLRGRWRQEELTISYRTPVEIMRVAAEVLAEIDPALSPPRAVRATGVTPARLSAPPDEFGELVVTTATGELASLEEGRVGVIVPAGRVDEIGKLVATAIPDAATGEQPELRAPVVTLTVRQAKGLEFDSVIVADPDGIVAESPRGRNDLYVALTRATQRLTIVEAAVEAGSDSG